MRREWCMGRKKKRWRVRWKGFVASCGRGSADPPTHLELLLSKKNMFVSYC